LSIIPCLCSYFQTLTLISFLFFILLCQLRVGSGLGIAGVADVALLDDTAFIDAAFGFGESLTADGLLDTTQRGGGGSGGGGSGGGSGDGIDSGGGGSGVGGGGGVGVSSDVAGIDVAGIDVDAVNDAAHTPLRLACIAGVGSVVTFICVIYCVVIRFLQCCSFA
jgi:hypothetical protein